MVTFALGLLVVGVGILVAVCWSLATRVEDMERQTLNLWYRADAQQLEILGLIEERHGAEAAESLGRARGPGFIAPRKA